MNNRKRAFIVFGQRYLFFKKWHLFFLLFIPFSLFNAQAQSPVLTYAHYVIDTLTSPTMNGRGYVDSGDFKAASFIQHEFEKLKLQSFTTDYFQLFYFNANVFPGKMKVKVDGRKLTPGKDFLADASSAGVKGNFKVLQLPHSAGDTSVAAIGTITQFLSDHAAEKIFIAYNKDEFTKGLAASVQSLIKRFSGFAVKGYMEQSGSKLTWDASQEDLTFCQLLVKDSAGAKFRRIKINIGQQLKENYLSRNVIGYIKGSTKADSFMVFTAHYDHLGQMGDGTYFPGANDNASGISMLLNLASYYSTHPPAYSVAFICFSGEELGLLGSNYFVEHPVFPMEKIKFLINLDIVGTGDDGIKVVNATEFPKPFDQLVKLNTEQHLLKTVAPRGKAANSDHYPFYMKGVPCFFIYTMGGISAYHDIYDRAETLPLTDYEDLFKLLIEFETSFNYTD